MASSRWYLGSLGSGFIIVGYGACYRGYMGMLDGLTKSIEHQAGLQIWGLWSEGGVGGGWSESMSRASCSTQSLIARFRHAVYLQLTMAGSMGMSRFKSCAGLDS